MSNFTDVARVGAVIWQMKQIDLIRSKNRALIDNLFNGLPPYTDKEVAENNISVNVNWQEGTLLLHQARRQYENAFLKPAYFFKVNLTKGPVVKRKDWSDIITKNINKPLKKSWSNIQLIRSKFAGVVLHGPGPQMWEDKHSWLPRFVAIEDLMIPTDAEISLDNLQYFAVRRYYTPGELFRKTHGKRVDPGWDVKAVEAKLDEYKDLNINPNQWTWTQSPEKMAELYKQNSSYFTSDVAPVIVMWDFFYKEEADGDKKEGWYRKMLFDVNGPDQSESPNSAKKGFAYDSGKRMFAEELEHILHIQFGDGNNKPPFLYHSIRSLGFMLFNVCQMNNRLRCKFTQHVFENLNILLRIQDPAGRAKALKVNLFDRGVMEEGVQIVPNTERHQVDTNMVSALLANFRQLIGEASSTYTQDVDTGTNKEQTATEIMAKVNSVNALLGSMLSMAYLQETFAYFEIGRRFCIKDSRDEDVKKFRARCIEDGVPENMLDIELWEIEPEQTLGQGNKVLEIAMAKELMSVRPLLSPTAQAEVLHIYIEAVINDPKLAERLAPLDATPKVTDSMHDAELSFGTMMQGVPVQVLEGTNNIEETETLLRLMAMSIKNALDSGGMGTKEQIIGWQLVAAHVEERIGLIAQDDQEKQRVKQYSDALGKLMNEVKGMAQRLMQKQGEQNGNDPEMMLEMQKELLMTKQKLAAKDAQVKQKMTHTQQKFEADQQRKDVQLQSDIQEQQVRTRGDLAAEGVKAGFAATAEPPAPETVAE
jgi:hypothetical protein